MAADVRARHVQLYGLQVDDQERYRRYREAMTPILHRYGGAFGDDFILARVLTSEVDAPINRVFTMVFPDPEASERFFADAEYRAVRAQWFEGAVSSVRRIGSWWEGEPRA